MSWLLGVVLDRAAGDLARHTPGSSSFLEVGELLSLLADGDSGSTIAFMLLQIHYPALAFQKVEEETFGLEAIRGAMPQVDSKAGRLIRCWRTCLRLSKTHSNNVANSESFLALKTLS